MTQPIDRLRLTYAGGIKGGSGGLSWCLVRSMDNVTWPCWFTDAFGNKIQLEREKFTFFQNKQEMTTVIQELRQELLQRNYKEIK